MTVRLAPPSSQDQGVYEIDYDLWQVDIRIQDNDSKRMKVTS